MRKTLLTLGGGAAAVVCLGAAAAPAAPVTFNPDVTAAYSQPCCDGGSGGGADELVNGVLTDGSGWANNGRDFGNVAVMELANPTGAGTGTDLVFSIISGGYGDHTLGRFRISATTDPNSAYGDGSNNAGDGAGTLNANWTPLDLTVVSSTGANSAAGTYDQNGPVLTAQGDKSLLASGSDAAGTSPEYARYVLSASAPFGGITGFRLEALTDPSLGAGHGPGFRSVNGNFVVVEFAADATAVPEPAALSLLGLGGLLALRRRAKA